MKITNGDSEFEVTRVLGGYLVSVLQNTVLHGTVTWTDEDGTQHHQQVNNHVPVPAGDYFYQTRGVIQYA